MFEVFRGAESRPPKRRISRSFRLETCFRVSTRAIRAAAAGLEEKIRSDARLAGAGDGGISLTGIALGLTSHSPFL